MGQKIDDIYTRGIARSDVYEVDSSLINASSIRAQ